METLNEKNNNQSIIPTTWDQMEKELPAAVNVMVLSAIGMSPANSSTLPIWYVLTKASGATGIDIKKLYECPMTRQHALATMAVDADANHKLQQHMARQQGMQGNGFVQQQPEGPSRTEYTGAAAGGEGPELQVEGGESSADAMDAAREQVGMVDHSAAEGGPRVSEEQIKWPPK